MLLLPVEADEREVFIARAAVARKLGIDLPFDGLLPVFEGVERVVDAVAVQIAEGIDLSVRGLGRGAEDGEEDLCLIIRAVQRVLRAADGGVERVEVAVGDKLAVDVKRQPLSVMRSAAGAKSAQGEKRKVSKKVSCIAPSS